MERKYTVGGREVSLEVDESAIAVRFVEGTPKSMRAATAAGPETQPFEARLELPSEKFTIVPLTEGDRSGTQRMSAASRLHYTGAVDRVAEVYKVGRKRAVATDRITIGLTPQAAVDELLASYDMSVLERFGDDEYLVRVPSAVDPIVVVNQLAGDQRVRYAEPDLVILGKHVARRAPEGLRVALPDDPRPASPDPYLADQYAIFITETDLARQMVVGDRRIRIAILDEGVDIGHPDLTAAIVATYDATDDDAWQEPQPWDAHGTACAGLAAAIARNGEGIVGVGAGASIMAVRIAFSRAPGDDWVTKESWIRRAIDWSIAQGADVLSNSWGGGAYSQQIVNAFERARRSGRSGRGAVVVVAAGNDSGPVDFPGNLDGILTVSASNQHDEFKTRSSADGERWWGSNFGSEIDLAAPGVANLTTDIRGRDGYHASDYTLFNGTSSSTPIVAGACALILSADPSLGEAEVRDLLKATADKVGGLPYPNGRNDQMGHGRLNVRRAVERLLTGLASV